MTAFSKIVVLDLECTCWRGPPPEGQCTEIIEIGVCLLNSDTLEISRPRRIFVKPEFSMLSDFCVELTGITPELIDKKGISKQAACDILMKEYRMDRRPFAAWGRDEVLLRQEFYLQPNGNYINIASLYGIIINAKRNIGLLEALKDIGLEFKGTNHQGGDDAFNAARILSHMISISRNNINRPESAKDLRKRLGFSANEKEMQDQLLIEGADSLE